MITVIYLIIIRIIINFVSYQKYMKLHFCFIATIVFRLLELYMKRVYVSGYAKRVDTVIGAEPGGQGGS